MNDEGSKVSLLWNPADMSSWWHDLVCETPTFSFLLFLQSHETKSGTENLGTSPQHTCYTGTVMTAASDI